MTAAPIAAGLTPIASSPALAQHAAPECQVDNEDAFHQAVMTVTGEAFRNGVKKVDFELVVRDQWNDNGLSALIDQLIDQSAEAVKNETAWSDLVTSIADQEQAKALAVAVAERVYRSDAFKKAVEDLATDAGREVAGYIELATIDAAVPAVGCVRSYLGSKYGHGIARIVADDTRTEFNPKSDDVSADVTSGDVALAGGEAIAGTMILLVRRTLTRMARRVGQRVVGAVLSRIVSVIAGGVGVVLIAKDIWDFRHGVLPIIVEEMKSERSKESVRAELTRSISEQMNEQIEAVARSTADRILAVWREFRDNHAKVVDFAARNEAFKTFVDGVSRKNLRKVDRVVGLILQSEGEGGVVKRLGDGTLDTAVRRLPAAAVGIASDTGRLEAGFAWHRLAGADVGKVAQYDIHRATEPREFSVASLGRVLELDDGLAISRLLALKKDQRAPLLEVEPGQLRTLLRRLSEDDLSELSLYFNGLTETGRQKLLRTIAEDPLRMQSVAGPGVRHAVLASRDQDAALAVMLRPSSAFDPLAFNRDFSRVVRGDISPYLLWAKHPYAVAIAGIIFLIVLLMLRRLFFGRRRPRPVEASE